MAHLAGTDRSQLLLLPDAVDDYVRPDNPARFYGFRAPERFKVVVFGPAALT